MSLMTLVRHAQNVAPVAKSQSTNRELRSSMLLLQHDEFRIHSLQEDNQDAY